MAASSVYAGRMPAPSWFVKYNIAHSFHQPPGTEVGPDLAFLRLSHLTISSLEANASVANLEIHKGRFGKDLTTDTKCLEGVAGVVDEFTPNEERDGSRSLLRVNGIVNVGRFSTTRTSNGFDLLDFEPDLSNAINLPSNYQGMSGGGMWRLRLQEGEAGRYQCLSAMLIGVAFWQTAPPDRKIVGHGPNSIYQNLLGRLSQIPKLG